MVDDQAELARRLDAGEELGPSEVAVLLGLSRATVDRMLKRGEIGFTLTPGGHRRCDPDDVKRLRVARLEKHREVPEEMLPAGPVKNAILDHLRQRGRGGEPPSPE